MATHFSLRDLVLDELDPGEGRTVDPWFLDGSRASRTASVVVAHLERAGRRFDRGTVSGKDLVIRVERVDLELDGMADDATLSAISAVAAGFERPLTSCGSADPARRAGHRPGS